jgi:hypothetical protein
MPDLAPLIITPELAEIVTGALDSGNVVLVAAVSPDAKPLASFRGSVAVFGDQQLSFWARNGEGGTVEAIRQNPNVVLVYRSSTVPVLQFSGRGRVVTDGEERERAYAISHAREQASDADKKGVAVIVELDRIFGVLIKDEGRAFIQMARG